MADRHLLARRLGVDVDDDRGRPGAERVIGEDRREPGERVVERVHEQPAHQVDDECRAAVVEAVQPPAGAGRARREIRRPQHARVALDIGDQLALVPDVIAGRQHVDAAIVEFAAQPLGQSRPMGRVLGVDDDEIERQIAAQLRDVLLDHLAPRPSHHVAAKQDVHAMPL